MLEELPNELKDRCTELRNLDAHVQGKTLFSKLNTLYIKKISKNSFKPVSAETKRLSLNFSEILQT